MNKRRTEILDFLSRRGNATVQELAGLSSVSVVTVRQDLTVLEREGFIRRTHGGAALLETDNIARRLSLRYEQKLRIAKKAASLVEDGETILVESGSANALLVRELAGRKVQIIAANVFIARQIGADAAARLVVLGGIYQPDSESLVGPLARLGIRETFFNRAFLGIDGFTPEHGFTNRDMMRAEIAAEVVSLCPQTYVLADSSKFGRMGLARICTLDELAGVITNSDIPPSHAALIRSSKADLHLA